MNSIGINFGLSQYLKSIGTHGFSDTMHEL